jgi:hypothetical protein
VTSAELLPLLMGGSGALMLSLVLNYAFFKGWLLNPRQTVRREDYDSTLAITARNTEALEKLAGRARGR